jgi:hypothetical protein
VPAVEPAAAVQEPVTLVGNEAFEELDGCLFVSADGREVACLHHALDMGFYESRLLVFDTSTGQTRGSYLFYTGSSAEFVRGDSADGQGGLQQAALVQANTHLSDGGFTQAGKAFGDGAEAVFGAVGPVLTVGSATFAGATSLPGLEGKFAQCCTWKAGEVFELTGTGGAVSLVWRRCSWQGPHMPEADAEHPCYDADYCGDECDGDIAPVGLVVFKVAD